VIVDDQNAQTKTFPAKVAFERRDANMARELRLGKDAPRLDSPGGGPEFAARRRKCFQGAVYR
jgi:hypothetical protein